MKVKVKLKCKQCSLNELILQSLSDIGNLISKNLVKNHNCISNAEYHLFISKDLVMISNTLKEGGRE